MGLFSKIAGTVSSTFQIGLGGPLWNRSVGALEARNAGNSAFAIARGAPPALGGASDLATNVSSRELAGGYMQYGASPLDRLQVAGLTSSAALTTGAPAANTLFALPLVLSSPGTTTSLLFNVTTLLSGNGRIGLYDATSETNLYPNSLIVDSGAISTLTTGLKTFATAQVLLAGKLYWLVYAQSAAATLRALALGAAYPIFGLDNALGTAPGVGLTVAFTFAALPATFPAGGAVLTAAPIPALAVKM